MSRTVLAGLLVLFFAGVAASHPVVGQSRSEGTVLDQPDAFERAFAVSSYTFDACGDPMAGRIFRRALLERFAHCPFSPAARSRFQQQTRAQLAKTRQLMDSMIESRGGLPMRLDGMSMTCHEQQSHEDYRIFRGRLDQYAQGGLPAEAIIAAPCDARDIAP